MGAVTNGSFPPGHPPLPRQLRLCWLRDEVNADSVGGEGVLGAEFGGTVGAVVGGGVPFVDAENVSLEHVLFEGVDGAVGEVTGELLRGAAGAMVSFPF